MNTIYIDFNNIEPTSDNCVSVPFAIAEFDFKNFYNKYKDRLNFVIVSRGSEEAVRHQREWLKTNVSTNIEMVNVSNEDEFFDGLDYENGVYISSNVDSLFNSIKLRILYNDGELVDCNNTDILVVQCWKDIDEILSFYSHYDYDTLDNKGEI